MKKVNSRFFEKVYPYFIPAIILSILLFCNSEATTDLLAKKMPDLLTISMTLSGVSLGFIGAMIGATLSIIDSKVMNFIYEQRTENILLSYIKQALIVNLITLVFSICLLIASEPYYNYILYVWFIVFVCGFLLAFRIIHLLFSLFSAITREKRKALNARFKPDKEKLKHPSFE